MAQFVGLRTATYGVGTHVISLTPPAGAQAGDTLFIQAMGWSTVGPPADPVGWSRLNRANSVLSSDYYSAVWQAPFGTAMSLTWTVPAGDNGLVVGLWAWRDAVYELTQPNYDFTSPYDGEAHAAGKAWFGMWGWLYPGSTSSPSLASWTERASTQSDTVYGGTTKFLTSPGGDNGPTWGYSNTGSQLRTRIRLTTPQDADVPPPSLGNCETQTFTPGSVVPQGSDGAVVYSSGALDSFGTDDTPPDWPTTGAKIKAIEVEVTATDEFTADGQIQTVVCQPGNLTAPISGATSDASGTWSGWDGAVGQYRSSGVDAYYWNKIGGWRTEYTSPTASISTSNTLQVGVIPAFGQDWAIEFEARRSSWSTSNYNTITGSGTVPLIAATSTGLWIRLAGTYAAWAPTISWAALGAVDGQWLKCRITYSTASRLNVYVDNGAGWTLVATPNIDTPATYTETATKWGAWYVRVGNGQNSSGLPQIGWDGDIRSVLIYSASTLIMDMGLDRMPTSTSYSWATTGGTASWFGLAPSPPPVTGASIPATQRVRWVADTPFPVEDVRLIVDAHTGALTVDEILIEAECAGGIYRDGRVHAS